ncbi:MAG: phosphate ABC transporter substrate-binding protein [Fimbriiglobus sp.]
MSRLQLMFVSAAGILAAGNAGAEENKLVLTGSSTVAPLAKALAEQFMKAHPGVGIDVRTGGSSKGIADARDGTADLGMSSRDLTDKETGVVAHPIARDGICLIVHKDNPVTTLTRDQVVGLYTGKVKNWKAVGGPDAAVVLVHKKDGRATLELFLHFFKLKPDQVKADVPVGDNAEGIEAVAGKSNAVGYVSIGEAARRAAEGAPIKLLPFDGVAASLQAVKEKTYPISRNLYLVTPAKPTRTATAFLAFAQSADAHPAIEQLTFVPLGDK